MLYLSTILNFSQVPCVIYMHLYMLIWNLCIYAKNYLNVLNFENSSFAPFMYTALKLVLFSFASLSDDLSCPMDFLHIYICWFGTWVLVIHLPSPETTLTCFRNYACPTLSPCIKITPVLGCAAFYVRLWPLRRSTRRLLPLSFITSRVRDIPVLSLVLPVLFILTIPVE